MQKSAYTGQYRAFVECLVTARKKAGLTQQQVADGLGRPQSFVAKYESAERRLDLVEFLAITRVLRADPKAIVKTIAALM